MSPKGTSPSKTVTAIDCPFGDQTGNGLSHRLADDTALEEQATRHVHRHRAATVLIADEQPARSR